MMYNLFIAHKKLSILLLLLTVLLLAAANEMPLQAQGDSWQASYWNNRFLTGEPVLQRPENSLNFDWGSGSPHPSVNRDNFSARWLRDLYLPMGRYRFTAVADDGMRVWVDDTLLIDAWQEGQVHSLNADITLLDGNHQIKVEYYEATGSANAQLDRQLLSGYESSWLARYYDNMSLSGEPVLIQRVPQISFSLLGAPVAEVGADNFSIQWTQDVPLDTGRYRFTMTADDGARLWVNDRLVIDAWHDQPATTYDVEVDVTGGLVPIRMAYYDNQGDAVADLDWAQITAVSPPPIASPGNWRGEYYNNVSLGGIPVMVREDDSINFNWGSSSPAAATIGGDRFSVRWTRTLDLSPGRYELTTYTDDGVRLWLNDDLRIDQWQVQPITAHSTTIDHPGGPLRVSMAYFENTGLAEARLVWTQIPTQGLPETAVPTATMIGASYLNVRAGPGLTYEPFSALRRGQTVLLIGRDVTAVWLNVTLPDNQTGWVSSRYMISQTSFVELPITSP